MLQCSLKGEIINGQIKVYCVVLDITLFYAQNGLIHVRFIHNKTTLLKFPAYLLTPWCRVLLEKLTGSQLVKKFSAFHGTRRFITALTSLRHVSLSWASPIQSIYPHPTSWRSILILFTHLCLGLLSGLFLSGFPTMTLYNPLSSPMSATCPAHLSSRFYQPHMYIYIYIYIIIFLVYCTHYYHNLFP